MFNTREIVLDEIVGKADDFANQFLPFYIKNEWTILGRIPDRNLIKQYIIDGAKSLRANKSCFFTSSGRITIVLVGTKQYGFSGKVLIEADSVSF